MIIYPHLSEFQKQNVLKFFSFVYFCIMQPAALHYLAAKTSSNIIICSSLEPSVWSSWLPFVLHFLYSTSSCLFFFCRLHIQTL